VAESKKVNTPEVKPIVKQPEPVDEFQATKDKVKETTTVSEVIKSFRLSQ